MGNRHYHGGDRQDEPEVEASWWRIAFSWLVTLAFASTVGPVSGDKAGAFVVFVVLFPVLVLLVPVIVFMGALTVVNAFRGTGPRPGNLMFWLEALPAAIGVLAGLQYLGTLREPW